MKKYILKKYKIERNSPCPCGSGRKFKKCCAQYLDLSPKLYDKAIDFLKVKKYEKAEVFFRAHLTQYIIWYHEHTVPFHNARPSEADSLLLIDIKAVMSFVFQIVGCLYHQKKIDEIDVFLKYSENIIYDPRHIFNVRSYRAFWCDYLGNAEDAKVLLRKSDYSNIKLITDNVFGRKGLLFMLKILCLELPLPSNLEILQALIECGEKDIDLVELLSYKALICYLYLDKTSAEKFIDEAIEKIRTLSASKDCIEEIYLAISARTWELKGIISESEDASRQAIEVFTTLLPLIERDIDMLSSVNSSIGRIYNFLGDLSKAKEYLQHAYNLKKTIVTSLDFAQNNSLLGNIEEAKKYLNEIQVKDMDKNLSIDYYATQANIAIRAADKLSARAICKKLENLDISIPQLKELRDVIRFALYDMIANKSDPNSIIQRIIKGMSHYLILQPSIFGIGINIDEIIKSWGHNAKHK